MLAPAPDPRHIELGQACFRHPDSLAATLHERPDMPLTAFSSAKCRRQQKIDSGLMLDLSSLDLEEIGNALADQIDDEPCAVHAGRDLSP